MSEVLNSSASRRNSRSEQRLLKTACLAFAQRGFHGTHVRDICRLAGISIAGVYYHFRDKQGLYEAVTIEARKRLTGGSKCDATTLQDMGPEKRLQAVIESLFERLGGNSEWIAQLAAREGVELVEGIQSSVCVGFRDDWALLQAIFRDLLGPQAEVEEVRMSALNVLSLSIFYCASRSVRPRLFPGLERSALSSQNLVRQVAGFALGAVEHRRRSSRVQTDLSDEPHFPEGTKAPGPAQHS